MGRGGLMEVTVGDWWFLFPDQFAEPGVDSRQLACGIDFQVDAVLLVAVDGVGFPIDHKRIVDGRLFVVASKARVMYGQGPADVG